MKDRMEKDERFLNWVHGLPNAIKNDPLWRIRVYQLSMYISDLGWEDITRLQQDNRTRRISDQLYRSLGSISANISEGFSRSTGKAKALYYEYALGSARENRDWYYKVRFVLGEKSALEKIDLLTQIIRLLTTMTTNQRQKGSKR